MPYNIDIRGVQPAPLHALGPDFSGASPDGVTLTFNNYYLERDGKPFLAVSGECHYSRLDPSRWEDAIVKMRMGGVDIVATYVFWNHIEETEGTFDFTGRRDLHRFVALCQRHGLYVILRVGPFAHGEARNGGLPDWLYGKPFEVRSTDDGFLELVRRLYGQIGQQVKGLFFRDGGPVIGVQLDNEYMHSSAPWEMTTGISDEWINVGSAGEAYILKLREIALDCGLSPVFFTGTAWGGAAYSPRVLPLWGGYPYRPWLFYSHGGEHPATEEYVYEDYHRDGATFADDFDPAYLPSERPYACCEMGGGMMCSYRYRFVLPYRSVDALANVKLGSGCNLIGYYMFHGGTNPIGRGGMTLNESQVPKRSYDYQAALGEFGQVRESYRRLKCIHHLLHSFGDRLAPMVTALPEGASSIDPSDTAPLRFAVRTDGERGFLFINNFQDHRAMPPRRHEHVGIETLTGSYDFDISLAPDENAILPFGFDLDGITLHQASAQPLLRTVVDERVTYVFMVPDGMDGAFRFEDGAVIAGVPARPEGESVSRFTVTKGERSVDVLSVSRDMANRLYRLQDGSLVFTDAALLEYPDGRLRLETTLAENTLYTLPADLLEGIGVLLADREGLGAYRICTEPKQIPARLARTAPHRWTVSLPAGAMAGLKDIRLQIDYTGDIGMLFLGNEMISDNFCNGDTWEVGLREHLSEGAAAMTLVVAPLRHGSRVSVESSMAARSERVEETVGEVMSVRAQAVYEILIRHAATNQNGVGQILHD